MKSLDRAITNAIRETARPTFPAWVFVTRYGLFFYAFVTSGVAFMISARLRLFWFLLPVIVSFLVTMILQLIFRRVRPDLTLTNYKLSFKTFSFPSAHSSISFSFATILSLLFLQYDAPYKWWFVVIFYLCAFLIAISRVILGVHYFSDVLIGSLLGTAVSAILIGL